MPPHKFLPSNLKSNYNILEFWSQTYPVRLNMKIMQVSSTKTENICLLLAMWKQKQKQKNSKRPINKISFNYFLNGFSLSEVNI